MKRVIKIILVVLIVAACGLFIYISERKSKRQEAKPSPPVRSIREESRTSSVAIVMPTNGMEAVKQALPVTPTNPIVSVATQQISDRPALPTEMVYKPIAPVAGIEVLMPILGVVSNAVLSADRILKSKQYKNVEQFNRTVWLEATDKTQSTIWRITPCGTNPAVGGIKAIVYQDDSFTQRDPARSFQAEFFPDGKSLRMFWWDDSHEMLMAHTNGPFSFDYARDLGGKKSREMRWDQEGNLVSSNVYNWATRGRVIGGTPQTNSPAYRFGPTSAVEAVTESWRRKVE